MKSPFPGMNPFLEGNLWSDVYNNLIIKIQWMLNPFLRPKYVARVERYVVEDDNPKSELGIMYPDVEVLRERSVPKERELELVYKGTMQATPATLSLAVAAPIKVNIPFLKIIDTSTNQLITAIEILSPVNKRPPGLNPFLKKRLNLYRAGVHFLEIDLLRRGKRTVLHNSLKDMDYLVVLTRAYQSYRDIWKIDLRSRLPIIPIPLAEEDKDVLLDLQQALDEVFVGASYDIGMDYTKTPSPPKMGKADLKWIKSLTQLDEI